MSQTDKILNYLYDKHFINTNSFSKVTSSYWRETGYQKVTKVDNNFTLVGHAFGHFIRNTLLNNIKYSVIKILSDYVLKSNMKNKNIELKSRETAKKQNRLFEFDCVKQTLSLNKIVNFMPEFLSEEKTVCIIGDGYGYLGSILKNINPKLTIVSVNLGKTLFFDTYYTRLGCPESQTNLLKENTDKIAPLAINFIEAENFELLRHLNVDLYININSMQEIDPNVTTSYFDYMRSSPNNKTFFYCCNRIEKVLPDQTVIKFFEFPWQKSDTVLFDELCPWFDKFPTSRPPFWLKFDGPTQHRLVKLNKTTH